MWRYGQLHSKQFLHLSSDVVNSFVDILTGFFQVLFHQNRADEFENVCVRFQNVQLVSYSIIFCQLAVQLLPGSDDSLVFFINVNNEIQYILIRRY